MMGRLLALVLLSWGLAKTFLTWPWRRRRSLRAFADAYGPDQLYPKSDLVHRLLTVPSGCIACRLCDSVVSRPEQQALSGIVMGAARSLPDAELSTEAFAQFSSEELAQAERCCPADVKIRDLATLCATASSRQLAR